jgi:Rod binding domain-containing protein
MSNINLKITNQSKHIAQTPEINSRFSVEEKKKLANAAKDFEAMLTSMMLKSMTQTTGGLFGKEGFGGDYFDTMFETQIASFMSNSKSFGVSDQIFRKITGEDLSKFQMEVNQKPALKTPIKIDKASIEEKAIAPSIGSLNRLDKYQDIISSASKKYGIDEKIIKSVILTESAGNPKAVSKANAKGLMQLMDGTAKDMGVKNSFDP